MPRAETTPSVPSPRRAAWSWRLVLVAYWVVLLVATHAPTPRVAEQAMRLDLDKLAHAGAYFVLATLLMASVGRPLSRRARLVAVIVVVVYGALDELTQPLTGRVADPLDWMADSIGALLALAASYAWSPVRETPPRVDLESVVAP